MYVLVSNIRISVFLIQLFQTSINNYQLYCTDVASGITMDWATAKANIKISYTYELRDEGEFGFLLPENQIIPNGEEFLAGLVALVQVA